MEKSPSVYTSPTIQQRRKLLDTATYTTGVFSKNSMH